MPIGHTYDKYNISQITLIGSNYVFYIRVEYRNPTISASSPGGILVQEFGNPRSTGTKFSLTNLLESPVTFVEVWSDPVQETHSVAPGYLAALAFRINSSQIMVGGIDSHMMYLPDDYSLWAGRVRLCGVKLHGIANSMVTGVGLRWCSYKAVLA